MKKNLIVFVASGLLIAGFILMRFSRSPSPAPMTGAYSPALKNATNDRGETFSFYLGGVVVNGTNVVPGSNATVRIIVR